MNSAFHIGSNLGEFTSLFYRSSKGFDGLNINVIHALFHGRIRMLECVVCKDSVVNFSIFGFLCPFEST